MLRKAGGALAFILSPAIAACATAPSESPAVPYIDAHSHIVSSIPADEEIARFRRAGLAGVVIMHPEAQQLEALARANPGYVVPFISATRTLAMQGLRLNDETAAAYERLRAAGAVCGFGEIPTRLEPNPEPNDAAAISNSARGRIFDLADARAFPVNIHVSLETPAVIDAVERAATAHPRMKLILAHAGWTADADTIGRLLAAHPNLYADLSVRLDPAGGLPGSASISILQPDGSLQPDWRALILRFPDRFLFGMDITQSGERPNQIEALFAAARQALGGLPLDVQHAVAHRNIERLVRGCAVGARR